jgi:hypothetical protein
MIGVGTGKVVTKTDSTGPPSINQGEEGFPVKPNPPNVPTERVIDRSYSEDPMLRSNASEARSVLLDGGGGIMKSVIVGNFLGLNPRGVFACELPVRDTKIPKTLLWYYNESDNAIPVHEQIPVSSWRELVDNQQLFEKVNKEVAIQLQKAL